MRDDYCPRVSRDSRLPFAADVLIYGENKETRSCARGENRLESRGFKYWLC